MPGTQDREQMAIRAGEFKLVRYDTNADTLTGARNQPTSPLKLYNVVADPHEDHDLAAAEEMIRGKKAVQP